MNFSIADIFSKCDQIRKKLQIWSHLLMKSVMKNFIFCPVITEDPQKHPQQRDKFLRKNCGFGSPRSHTTVTWKLNLKKSTTYLYHIIATMTVIKCRIVTHRLASLFLSHLCFPGSNNILYLAQESFFIQFIHIHSERASKTKLLIRSL